MANACVVVVRRSPESGPRSRFIAPELRRPEAGLSLCGVGVPTKVIQGEIRLIHASRYSQGAATRALDGNRCGDLGMTTSLDCTWCICKTGSSNIPLFAPDDVVAECIARVHFHMRLWRCLRISDLPVDMSVYEAFSYHHVEDQSVKAFAACSDNMLEAL